MAEILKQYISGTFTKPTGGICLETRNPAMPEELVSTVHRASAEEVNRSVEAAARSLTEWKAKTVKERAYYLKLLFSLIEQNKEKLARTITIEMGKTIHESRSEVDASLEMIECTLDESFGLAGDYRPSTVKGRTTFAKRVPLGVVGLITPWNFPLSTPILKLAPALLTGNTVILKPAEDASAVACLLAELIDKTGMPNGVFNCILGSGETGDALVNHHLIDGISFTGSSSVGRKIAETCGHSLKRLSLELGGKNPLIIMDDADISKAVRETVSGAFGIAGQRCSATSRLLLHESIQAEFLEEFLCEVNNIDFGNGMDEKNRMGAIVNKKQWERVKTMIDFGIQEGATLKEGGYDNTESSYFIKPTVFTDVQSKMSIAQEEIFGPIVAVITFKSIEEAIAIANDTSYGLTSGIFTSNLDNIQMAIDGLDSGSVMVNASTAASETHMPFGGRKASGNGHCEGGWSSIDSFTEWKTVYIN
ncbi:aldehyde dehydrogenase (NAD+) [Scopulibacillus darangshiensis]|uniref:aldehyde dehydrogenase (NAD(+)) n=1 Tax=Scopulibacillus darangshiensis TaxID=442528 RepID=A0A4R2NK99_9BACL|nr:aldehyde dehydrogenase family protein [Scopulibacillus darangshiensis]TCP21881.1 aldehyde dehydrogenase (NAD+) [Scopulibacillus darangshiensis]